MSRRALKFQKFRCGNLVTFYAGSEKMNPVVCFALAQRGNYVVGACGGVMINSSTLELAIVIEWAGPGGWVHVYT